MEPRAQPFAEEAIRALGRRDVPGARTAISQAFDVDPKLGQLADAVYLACADLEEEGEVSTAAWNTLADAVDSPDLLAEVEANRS